MDDGSGLLFGGARPVLILGLCDGARPAAAVVVDGQPQVEPGECWSAAERLLARVGARADQVELVAVAGRFSPSFAERRAGRVRRDPWVADTRLAASWDHLRRSTGLGAVDADRSAEWFDAELVRRGYRPRRVVLVDAHRCAASAAYRCQPADDTLVAVVLPHGDGAFASVHRASAGQIDRLYADTTTSTVHLWLDRALDAAGVPGWDGAEVLAAGGAPDLGVAEALAGTLRLDDGRFVARRMETRRGAPWRDLARLPRSAAAATALDLLRTRVREWLRLQLDRFPTDDLALGGWLAGDPRVVAEAAELGPKRVWAGPWTGGGAQAVGAALWLAGTAPALPPPPESGAESAPDGVAWGSVDPDRVAAVLADGGAVGRYLAPAPHRPWGSGWRSVLVRADHRDALRRARGALQRPDGEQVGVLTEPGALRFDGDERVEGPLRYGLVAPRIDGPALEGARGEDRRIPVGHADPALVEILARLKVRTGAGAVAALPLALGSDPPTADEQGAVDVARRAKLPLLVLGRSAAELA
jgi:hypothetical protein